MTQTQYLSELGLTPEEHKALAALGATNAAALWSMWRAAPDALEKLLGEPRADGIHRRLRDLLTPEERQRLDDAPPAKRYAFGASLRKPSPHLPPPPFDIEERDRIFSELQSLRGSHIRSAVEDGRILELETALNHLLEKHYRSV